MKKIICIKIAVVLLMITPGSLFSTNPAVFNTDTIPQLPEPFETKSTKNFSKVIGWKNGETPIAPTGFTVTKFADNLEHPRWIYVAGNGDIFVAESNTILKGIKKFGAKISRKIKTQHIGESANRITMFRDADKNGIPESRNIFAQNLEQPFGMLIIKNNFYIANTNALLQFQYRVGDTVLSGPGKMIVPLNASKPNRHWTRNIIANEKEDKIYIAVGSASNNAENGLDAEIKRATILEVNPDGSGERVYASGLRNPVGMAWEPVSKVLWTAVNERDLLGDDLVPDYLTGVIKDGFYGWPFAYYGANADPRMKDDPKPELVSKTIVPDLSLGAHTASLGLLFYTDKKFPEKYHNGAFITQHGSWNRKELSGYKVVFVPFAEGKPSGLPEDFLTGFLVPGSTDSEVHGRPVGIAVLEDGSMLVSDDTNNTIWRVNYTGK